jgi:adenosylcobinamide kinase/adenosylcobinamide-phosphate guanylyltransferase
LRGTLILVLGGARGGKSSWAQRRAEEIGGPDVLYVATAEALDEEMKTRIAAHKADRPKGWRTLETPTLIGVHFPEEAHGARVVLLDCLTLLASNAMLSADAEPAAGEAEAAVEVVVTNEVGLGLVPANSLGRTYRDALGRANQRLAALADEVVLMVAGLPLRLK